MLKERNVKGYAPIYRSLTNQRISEVEAKSIAQKLLTFISQKEGGTYSITSASKVDKLWKVGASSRNQEVIVEINSNTGEVEYLDSSGTKISMDRILQMVN
ncbi:MAG: PepSY domain-containing protein [Candidatus Woesearchaeota archaeon]